MQIYLIKTNLRPEENQTGKDRPKLLLGTKKIVQTKTLRFIIIIFAFLMFANASLNSFLVAFEEQEMHMSSLQFGLSVSLLGGSAVVSGLLLTSKISKINRPLILIAGTFLAGGIIFLPVLIINQAWELYLMFILLGPVNIFVNVAGNIVFFRDTKDIFRGQVFSALDMLISLFNIIGIIYGVLFSSVLNLRYLFFGNALIFIVIGLLALIYLFFLNNLDFTSKSVEIE